MATVKPHERDFRIDFFRGLALLFIFIDHIPQNLFGVLTLRNFGFSDAAEIFIFLSGYSAGYVFTLRRERTNYTFATVENLRRVWTLYVVHIFVFVLFTAQVAFTATKFNNPIYVEEMNMSGFLAEPHVAVIEALFLRFQPRFLDILPLYIVLLLVLPIMMLVPRRWNWLWLAASAGLWLAVQTFHWHPLAYPDDREWTFNPLAWQFLFSIGAWLGQGGYLEGNFRPRNPWLLYPPAAYLLFAFVVGVSWTIQGFYENFPALLDDTLFPLDKTNLSPWRLAHFLCLAVVVAHFMPPASKFFQSRIAKPLVTCGRHSLNLFCLGIFLSFIGHLVVSEFNDGVPVQFLVNFLGCAVMILMAVALDWLKDSANAMRAPKPAASVAAAPGHSPGMGEQA